MTTPVSVIAGRRGLTLSALGALGGLALAGAPPVRAQDPAPPPAASVPGPTVKQDRKRSAPRRVRPVRVSIPAIGVRARVTRLGLNADRTLQVPKVWGNTGWWSGGPAPGQHGPAVIVGHVDSTSGPAVLYRLRELGDGDFDSARRSYERNLVVFATREHARERK